MMAKAISGQCELSCDAEIIQNEDVDTRQHYSKTIIGAIKRQSKLKTALSTNFYGGKKGMKKIIFTTMDTGKKKANIVIFCVVLAAVFGTGFVFASNGSIVIPESSNVSTPNLSAAASERPNITNPSNEQGNTTSANHGAETFNKTIPLRIDFSGVVFSDTMYRWPFHEISVTNISDKPITNFITVSLAYDKDGNPLELYWDALNVSADGSVGSVGTFPEGSHGIVVDIYPVSSKSFVHVREHIPLSPPDWMIAQRAEYHRLEEWLADWETFAMKQMQEEAIFPMQSSVNNTYVLFDGWNQSTGEHIVEHIITIVKEVVFEDGSVWVNPDVDNWLVSHRGRPVRSNAESDGVSCLTLNQTEIPLIEIVLEHLRNTDRDDWGE